jgi:hypothetical protein
VYHRLHPGSNRSKTSQPQQVHRCSSKCGHRSGAIAAVAVGILVELGVWDPVPALYAPEVSNQLQQGFWGSAQAGEKEVSGLKGLAVAAAGGRPSTIQLVPIQASRMCSGAALARSVQVMVRPWLIS